MYLEQLRSPGQMTPEEKEVLQKLRGYLEASKGNGHLLRTISWLIEWPVTSEFARELDVLCYHQGFRASVESFEHEKEGQAVLSARVLVAQSGRAQIKAD